MPKFLNCFAANLPMSLSLFGVWKTNEHYRDMSITCSARELPIENQRKSGLLPTLEKGEPQGFNVDDAFFSPRKKADQYMDSRS